MSNTFDIRKEESQDRDNIRWMHELAFGSKAVAKLVDDLRESRDALISLVAIKNDQIVGHVMLSRLEAPMKAMTLAPLAVHPDFRKQGIGAALVRKGLELAKENKCDAVFVLGDTGYYEGLGFSVEKAKGFSSPYAGDHFMVLSFDAAAMPMAGEIVYPSPFSQLP